MRIRKKDYKMLKATAMGMRRNGEKVRLEIDRSRKILDVYVSDLEEQDWERSKVKIQEVENYISADQVYTVRFFCEDPSDINLRFIMWVLNVVERFRRQEARDTKVFWNVDERKAYHVWLKEKLLKSFNIDIKFSGFFTSGGLV